MHYSFKISALLQNVLGIARAHTGNDRRTLDTQQITLMNS
jgi:hypothetical protein